MGNMNVIVCFQRAVSLWRVSISTCNQRM